MHIRRLLASCSLAGAVLVGAAAPAMAQAYPGGTSTNQTPGDNGAAVLGEQVSRPVVQPAQVQGSGLALTGSDIAELTFIGLGLTGTGVVLVRRARRRPAVA